MTVTIFLTWSVAPLMMSEMCPAQLDVTYVDHDSDLNFGTS